MAKRAVVVLTLVVVGCAGARLAGRQTSSAPSTDHQSYTAATTAILVDVVVRDHKGQLVTDLTADDFSLTEDGNPQKIATFTRVTRGGGIGLNVRWKAPGKTSIVAADGSEPEAGADGSGMQEGAGATALVYDHLSEDALHLAQKATLNYIPMNGESKVWIGVFATQPAVSVVQPFTTDRAAVRHAVEKLMTAGTSSTELASERRDQIVDRRRDLLSQNQALVAAAAIGSGPGLAQNGMQMGRTEMELQLLEMERSMIDSFGALDRDHRGYDTTLSLITVIRSLAEMPGRKSVVFFSEGLPVSPVLATKLDDLISAANRANVSVYTIDAHGLATSSSLHDTRKQMVEFGEERLEQVASGSDHTNRPLTRDLERVEDLVRLDSRSGLARLSADTGGILIADSNDLTSAFKRIDEDNQFHYMLSYSPSNNTFDGKFRTIDVKVKRPGVDVFSRKGYRAIRSTRPGDITTYETPALALLDKTPLPNAFPMRAAGFTFPDPAHPGLSPVIVHFDTDVLEFNVDQQRATYSAQAIVLVRIRNADGQTVHKLSQQYILSGDSKDIDAAKHGTILFYRQPDLLPGVYSMETIVLDPLTGKSSARVSTLDVPATDSKTLGMSSLVLVNRTEETGTAPENTVSAPLFVGKTLIYPNAGEPIAKSSTNTLSFYFTLYGEVEGAEATAELMKDGRVLAEAPLPLPAASGSRTQHVGKLPIGGLPPGTYELMIRVASNGRELSRTAFFTLQE